ncbi:MAG TPA: GNAT family N-acetyltransferase [Pseudolabrys sp.]|nr:GNAT family N-acetyltransferase [Pseudolabrys sp.]
MSEVMLRKLSDNDLPRVIEILSYWNMAPVEPTATVPVVETTGLEPERTTIAIVRHKIVGVASYIVLDNGWAETVSLAVDPAWRGHGIGEKLQIARLKEMKKIGIQNVKTESDRPEVIGWYIRKFGYRVAGTSPKKHDFCRHDVTHWTVLNLDLRKWHPRGAVTASSANP